MPSDVQQPGDFIAYPTNRVVGTIADPTHARAAIEALLQAGFAQKEIEILHAEEDRPRTAPAGSEHRFLAQFQRTLIRKIGEYKHLRLGEEFDHLQHYVEDVQAGRSVIMVLAKKPEKRETAADILGLHGAEAVEFFGRWSWQTLETHPAAPDESLPDPAPGRTYEIHLGDTDTRVRLESASRVTILRKSDGSRDLARIPVTPLKPQLLLVTWQEADRTTHVHVYDFESGEAHAVVSSANRTVHSTKGTIRRVV